jgi:hypothetical protein
MRHRLERGSANVPSHQEVVLSDARWRESSRIGASDGSPI